MFRDAKYAPKRYKNKSIHIPQKYMSFYINHSKKQKI